jgi:biopolymer transport protein ExbD
VKTASSSEKYQLVAEINMVPFIDITLVLLIIVMVMTPFLVKEQIKINLPATKAAHDPVDSKRLLQIDVTREGAIRVDGQSVEDDGVYEAIRSRLTDPENQPVVIAADRDVPFEKVVVAMDAAKRCGAKRMGVSVKRGDTDGPSTAVSAENPKPRSSAVSAEKPKSHSPSPSGGAKRSPARPRAAKQQPGK